MVKGIIWIAGAIAVLAGLYGLHRLALWLERKGYIYYTKRGSASGFGNGIQGVQQIFEPGIRYVVDVKHEEHRVESWETGPDTLKANQKDSTGNHE